MDIKEIALNVADSMSNTTIIMPKNEDLIAFAEAIIESYKAELLKEVRGPVAEFKRHPFGDYTELSFSAGYSARRGDKLYTSDQIAAAIAKATKPLEEEIERLKQQSANRLIGLCKGGEDNDELRAQLAAAQEEIKTVTEQKNRMWFEMQTAQDQLAKAEQRVAEACAEVCDEQDHPECWIHKDCAEAIRSGEWRKFVKEG